MIGMTVHWLVITLGPRLQGFAVPFADQCNYMYVESSRMMVMVFSFFKAWSVKCDMAEYLVVHCLYVYLSVGVVLCACVCVYLWTV